MKKPLLLVLALATAPSFPAVAHAAVGAPNPGGAGGVPKDDSATPSKPDIPVRIPTAATPAGKDAPTPQPAGKSARQATPSPPDPSAAVIGRAIQTGKDARVAADAALKSAKEADEAAKAATRLSPTLRIQATETFGEARALVERARSLPLEPRQFPSAPADRQAALLAAQHLLIDATTLQSTAVAVLAQVTEQVNADLRSLGDGSGSPQQGGVETPDDRAAKDTKDNRTPISGLTIFLAVLGGLAGGGLTTLALWQFWFRRTFVDHRGLPKLIQAAINADHARRQKAELQGMGEPVEAPADSVAALQKAEQEKIAFSNGFARDGGAAEATTVATSVVPTPDEERDSLSKSADSPGADAAAANPAPITDEPTGPSRLRMPAWSPDPAKALASSLKAAERIGLDSDYQEDMRLALEGHDEAPAIAEAYFAKLQTIEGQVRDRLNWQSGAPDMRAMLEACFGKEARLVAPRPGDLIDANEMHDYSDNPYGKASRVKRLVLPGFVIPSKTVRAVVMSG